MNAQEIDEAVREESSRRRWLDELTETQSWAHHVADLDNGQILTTALDRPVTPLSRMGRLSQLGHTFDTSIFDGPSYVLTPRRPIQTSPAASFSVAHPDAYNATENLIVWNPPRELGTNFVPRGMRFIFAVSPDRRSVVSLALTGKAFQGMVGHVTVRPADTSTFLRIPFTESS